MMLTPRFRFRFRFFALKLSNQIRCPEVPRELSRSGDTRRELHIHYHVSVSGAPDDNGMFESLVSATSRYSHCATAHRALLTTYRYAHFPRLRRALQGVW